MLFLSYHETLYLSIDISAGHPPLHALIIGINKYKSPTINNLSGAVADADAMEQYLRSELHVPADHITNLRDDKATRAAILNAFRALQTQDSISEDDAILIYYSGHGSSGLAPDDWSDISGQRISFIVPYDSRTMHDADKKFVLDIPDRESRLASASWM